jgi:hypothetical protein
MTSHRVMWAIFLLGARNMDDKEKLAQFMIKHGLATGHGAREPSMMQSYVSLDYRSDRLRCAHENGKPG